MTGGESEIRKQKVSNSRVAKRTTRVLAAAQPYLKPPVETTAI